MENLLKLISNPGFTSFLATYGLATVIVLYIILIRDPHRYGKITRHYDLLNERYTNLYEEYRELSNSYRMLREKLEQQYQQEYDKLCQSYEDLKGAYDRLEHDLKPETRRLSGEQASKLAELGLDRDLYKLYYYISEKLEGNRKEDLEYFIADSVRDTNQVWLKFISPFPGVPHIGNLYGVYKNHGGSLKADLAEILSNEEMSTDEKRLAVWKKLLNDTLNMKREFDSFLEMQRQHREVHEYQDKPQEVAA